MKINFFTEDFPFKLQEAAALKKWIAYVVVNEGYRLKELNYIFCSDTYLHSINLQYLNHDTYTDIITFDRSEREDTIAADIYISIERVEENARELSLTFYEELHRVLIHGVLHLCGYTDKTDDETTAMRNKEDACLSLLAER